WAGFGAAIGPAQVTLQAELQPMDSLRVSALPNRPPCARPARVAWPQPRPATGRPKSPALLAALALLTAFSPALAQPAAPATPPAAGATQATGANLNISPKRITFDRNHRSGSIYVFNQGRGTGSFDISLIDRVMLPDGQIVPL